MSRPALFDNRDREYPSRFREDTARRHQEIHLYLGVYKFALGRIHKTLSGDWVRSKSEVIIANLLYER